MIYYTIVLPPEVERVIILDMSIGEAKDADPVARAIAMKRTYYRREPCGGFLHIVLDDGNVEDSHVEFCRDEAREGGDEEAVVLAELLLTFTVADRIRVYEA